MDQLIGKRIFITGGAGFIGTKLIGRLVEDNEIVAYDNLSRNSLQDASFRHHRNLTMVHGDILDPDRMREAMAGADIIVHAAAIAGVDTVLAHPTTTMLTNVVGTANVLTLARGLEVERVLCFSTSEVFGQYAFNAEESNVTSMGPVGESRWTYAVSKLAGEHMAHAFFREHGLPVTVVRPFNVYGPGQVGNGAIRTFVKRAIENLPLEIHGDGTQIRAWCYVDDMVEGCLAALTHPAAVGESFNIGNHRATVTIYGLASAVVRVLRSSSDIVFVKRDYVDVELRVPSVAKARDLIGFSAKVDLDEGLRKTASFYRKHREVRVA